MSLRAAQCPTLILLKTQEIPSKVIFVIMFRIILFLALLSLSYCGATYYVYATTWDRVHAGTDSDIYIRLHGYKGVTSWYLMNLPAPFDDFTRGDTDYYSFSRSEDVGGVLCAELKTGGGDAALIYKLKITSTRMNSGWVTIYNSRGQWLSRDSDEGVTQAKWCQNDCALDLPLSSSSWHAERTDYDLTQAVVVTNLAPTVLGSGVVDATHSSQDIQDIYFVYGTAEDITTFTKEGGVPIVQGAQFDTHPITVVDSAASVDTSKTLTYQINTPLKESEKQEDWGRCRAPAGKKVKCSTIMDKTGVRVPFTQTWRHRTKDSCSWVIAGQAIRLWSGKVKQRLEVL